MFSQTEVINQTSLYQPSRSIIHQTNLPKQSHMKKKKGEHELILSGIHESFNLVNFSDPRLAKTSELLDWLVFSSQLQKRIDVDQVWSLLGFMPAVAAKVKSSEVKWERERETVKGVEWKIE